MLSVKDTYLDLERGRPFFKQNYTCSALLEHPSTIKQKEYRTEPSLGISPFYLPRRNDLNNPFSLTTTYGISIYIDFFSSSY